MEAVEKITLIEFTEAATLHHRPRFKSNAHICTIARAYWNIVSAPWRISRLEYSGLKKTRVSWCFMLGEYLLDIIMCKETVLHKKDRKVVYQKTESSEWKASSIQFHNYMSDYGRCLTWKKKTGRHFKSVQNIFCLVLKSSSFNCNIDNILSYIVFSFSFLPRSVVAEAIVDLGGAVGNMETPVVYYEF